MYVQLQLRGLVAKGVLADDRPFPLDVINYAHGTNQTLGQGTHFQIGPSGQYFYFAPPKLDITAFWLGANDANFITTAKLSENGTFQIVSSLNFSGNGVLNTSQLRFTNDWNQTNPTLFDLSYIEEWGSCQPVSNVGPCAT